MIDHARYEVVGDVGRGAQGHVVRVIDRERPDAKLVAKVLCGAAGSSAALEGELALLARLRAPGLVRAHDLTRDRNGTLFLVEDLVEGMAPDSWLHASPSTPRFLALATALAETLAALHDAGLVHGDVKPDNVRVAERPVLLDLGAATGAAFTPAFAAPEVRATGRPSAAGDVFALGATLHVCAARRATPDARPVRDHASWLAPSVADVVDRMRAPHPADRPAAREILAALGQASAREGFEGVARARHVREEELRRVLAATERVLWVVGPSGAGKSHLAREILTRALLAGRPARMHAFPEPPETTRRLLERLRAGELDDALVFLDGLDAAPVELAEAVDAFRCRMHVSSRGRLVVTARIAPRGAAAVTLGPLDDAALAALGDELGASAAAIRGSGGLPGWLVAAAGRAPLTKEAALARVRELGADATAALALVATMNGTAPERLVTNAAPLFAAGLLVRERDRVRLASPHLASDLAVALAAFADVDRIATLALAADDLDAASLLAVAQAEAPPAARDALLGLAAERARRDEARAIEIDALLALLASPTQRTSARLARLERVTRDAGAARSHPQVLTWLSEAAERDPSLAPLALRRRAEERARAGDREQAEALAREALERSDETNAAYAHATRGAIALFRADWSAADQAFARAHAALATAARDEEEIARLEHNAGVVALYRGEPRRAAAAFERSLEIKRRLGDRAGVRACLLNLGLALAKESRWDDADAALVEATALAESLGQAGGRAWCLAARADVAVRRSRARDAERLVAEAEAIGDAVPAPVRADLALLRAQIALLEGAAAVASAALSTLAPDLRADDALVDARALVLESRAALAGLPANRRTAARKAIAAVRRARAAGLAEVEPEAVSALRAARGSSEGGAMPHVDVDTWTLLRAIADAASEDDAALAVAAHVVRAAGAERAFVVALDDAGAPLRAWGADLDGLPIAQALERVDREALASARRSQSAVSLPDVVTAGGRGARIAAAGARAAVLAEHRFAKNAFAGVAASEASRWATLADLAVRAVAAPSTVALRAESVASSPNVTSTAVPRREAIRDYPTILGRSASLRRALAQLDAAVDTELPVLVRGETGAGKELFARALHDHGARRAGPFVAVSCAAIADALFEAELFGHAKGAFTGAERAREGLLARANGGTLFLDEIGELPAPRQATLLRVLETRHYRPVGSDEERAFDVRLVTATNRDLDAEVEAGSFRRDLLFRIRVLEIIVPPLREREGDVELLLRHFLARAGARATLTPAALATIAEYTFPGNVRELAHLAQRLAASRETKLDVGNLPRAIRAGASARPAKVPADERAEVEDALAKTGGNISRAATLLGITRHGLKKRMLRLGVRAKTQVGT